MAQAIYEQCVVADGKPLQIPQTLAAAQDSQHRHQQQIRGSNPHLTLHPRVWDCFEVADQIVISRGENSL